MKVKTKVKAGGIAANHNQTLVRAQPQATARPRPQGKRQALKIKSGVKAGGNYSRISQDIN